MGPEALIPMRLFRSGTFAVGLGVSALIGLGMFGAIMCPPRYLQIVQGASPTKAGPPMLPMMVGIMTLSVASGQITMGTGRYKIFSVLGAVFLMAAFALLLMVTVGTPFWKLDIYFFLLGMCLGMNMQTLTIAIQNAVPAKDIGVSTVAAPFFRQPGGTLGVASCRRCSTRCRTASARRSGPRRSGRPSSRRSARRRKTRTTRRIRWRPG